MQVELMTQVKLLDCGKEIAVADYVSASENMIRVFMFFLHENGTRKQYFNRVVSRATALEIAEDYLADGFKVVSAEFAQRIGEYEGDLICL